MALPILSTLNGSGEGKYRSVGVSECRGQGRGDCGLRNGEAWSGERGAGAGTACAFRAKIRLSLFLSGDLLVRSARIAERQPACSSLKPRKRLDNFGATSSYGAVESY